LRNVKFQVEGSETKRKARGGGGGGKRSKRGVRQMERERPEGGSVGGE
jgi:hypothetical protein